MKLEMFTEAGTRWTAMQERSIEELAGEVATSVHKMVSRTITARETSSTCTANGVTSFCEKPATSGNTQTIAIALGARYVQGAGEVESSILTASQHSSHLRIRSPRLVALTPCKEAAH